MSTKQTHFKERTVAKWLKLAAKERNALVFKMHPITDAGIPDTIVHMAGRTFYVETKTTGEQCTPIQIEQHARLKKAGIDTYVLDTKIKHIFDLFIVAYTTYEGKHYKKNPFKNT